jgi:2-aminoadipate transaminase
MICERFLNDFDTDGHIQTIKDLYRRKCGLMLSEMDKNFPIGVKYTRPEGGLFVWCTLPAGSDIPYFVKRALELGVAVVPGTAFNCDVNASSDSFRLNFSTPADEQIIKGIKILSDVLKEIII